MRLALFLLLSMANLSWSAIDPIDGPECTGFDLPNYKTPKCWKEIHWRIDHPDENQRNRMAYATCLDYFPTYFVTPKLMTNTTVVRCVVSSAFQCIEPNAVLIYDKCFVFEKTAKTIDEAKCSTGGKISVIYSLKQAQFIAKQAIKIGIGKLWIGTGVDGRTIDKENMLLHSNMFNMITGDYWKGDQLIKLKPGEKNADAKYLFLRTRTDYELTRWQGNFEMATKDTTAAFACEFEAKMVSNQKWYCDKMAALSIDAHWSEKGNEERCIYKTFSKYSFTGTKEGLPQIKGCLERPTAFHSSGMDDGTAHEDVYKAFGAQTVRLAGYPHSFIGQEDKCAPGNRKITTSLDERRMDWRLLDNYGKRFWTSRSSLFWKDDYPTNECTDFPGNSNTMAMSNGKLIDLPREVRAPALCSLSYFHECENKNNPCGNKICTNENEFFSLTGGFFSCSCPSAHEFKDGQCKWSLPDNYCAELEFYNSDNLNDMSTMKAYMKLSGRQPDGSYVHNMDKKFRKNLIRVVVRNGYIFDLYANEDGNNKQNMKLLEDLTFGSYDVPSNKANTMGVSWKGRGMNAIAHRCKKLEP